MFQAHNPIPPPLLLDTVYVYTVYLFTQEGGGGVEPERRLEGQQFTNLGRKYQHDWLYLQSINSDKHLPQTPFIGQFFRWRHFACCPQYIGIFCPCSPDSRYVRIRTEVEFILFCSQRFKLKILSSQKIGGSRGVPIDSSPLRTQSPMFFRYP